MTFGSPYLSEGPLVSGGEVVVEKTEVRRSDIGLTESSVPTGQSRGAKRFRKKLRKALRKAGVTPSRLKRSPSKPRTRIRKFALLSVRRMTSLSLRREKLIRTRRHTSLPRGRSRTFSAPRYEVGIEKIVRKTRIQSKEEKREVERVRREEERKIERKEERKKGRDGFVDMLGGWLGGIVGDGGMRSAESVIPKRRFGEGRVESAERKEGGVDNTHGEKNEVGEKRNFRG
jgi:hypothetical protein